MGFIEDNLGALTIGILLNTYLYGIVSYQYSSYFSSSMYKDPLWIKSMVAILFALDTFHSTSLIYFAWNLLIVGFANPMVLRTSRPDFMWPYPTTVIVTALSALLVHIFLCYRILRLTNKFICAIVSVLSVGSFACGVVACVKAFNVVVTLELVEISGIMSAWLSLEVVVDTSITGILIVALTRSRTGFYRSNTVINRLVRTTIQTGLLTSLGSILSLAFLVARQDTALYATFGLPISRLYTNTLMDTLLCREELRDILNEPETISLTSIKLRRNILTDINLEHNVKDWSTESSRRSRRQSVKMTSFKEPTPRGSIDQTQWEPCLPPSLCQSAPTDVQVAELVASQR